MTRAVSWDGIHNARDLGGLSAAGSVTQYGRFYRTPRLDGISATGWEEIVAAGVRTIVDLRNDDEVAPLAFPVEVRRFGHPIEDQTNATFMDRWGAQLNSPAYYAANLDLWPDRIAAAFRRFAHAEAGAIIFHCSAGRDRTGLITAMLLQLVGVSVEDIVADYTVSVVAMNDYFAAVENPRERARSAPELEHWIARVQDDLRQFLLDSSTEQFLRRQGIAAAELDGIRTRLLADQRPQ